MSAPTVIRVLAGSHSAACDPDTGLPLPDPGLPELHARIQRHGLHVEWSLYVAEYGPVLAWGTTRTKGRAKLEAIITAQRPSIQAAARRAVRS